MATTAAITGAAAQAAPRKSPTAHLTLAEIDAMTPLQQHQIYGPLDDIADVVTSVGKGPEKDVYSTVAVDGPNGAVDVWLTNPKAQSTFLRAMRRVNSRVDTHRIVFKGARYNLVQMHASRDQLLSDAAAHTLPYRVYAVAVQPDGSGLEVRVDSPATATAAASHLRSKHGATYDGVAVDFRQGHPFKPADQAQTKWDDGAPQIGGDAITDGTYYCTAGIPAVNSSGTNVMITANHCFSPGTDVYTPGGTHPAFGSYYTKGLNGVRDTSHYVGRVVSTAPQWDAEELTGGTNNADVQLSDTWHPVTSIKYSYQGDPVCQSGAASYYMGYGNVCGIHVTNQDITYQLSDWSGYHNVRGVEGTRLSNSAWAVAEGDSGGLVYVQTGSNSYQARGIVSGYPTASACCYAYGGHDVVGEYIDWTEAPDILGHFGLSLNPHT